MNPAQFAADLSAAQVELRAFAEARMTSRVTIYRPTGRTTQNEDTGREVPVWDEIHTDIPFRLKHGRNKTVTIGGVEFEEASAEGSMPAAIHDLRDGDHADLTAGEWAGTAWRIVEAIKGDQMTARRVPIVEVDRPGEWDE